MIIYTFAGVHALSLVLTVLMIQTILDVVVNENHVSNC